MIEVQLDGIIDFFKAYLPLDNSDIQALRERCSSKRLRRRQFLLSEGDICRHYYYVVSGLLRMYKLDEAGKEHNFLFSLENTWITDIGSFHSESPSELFIEAVEDTVIIQLKKTDLLHFYTNFPKFDRNFRVIIEDQYVALQKRMLLSMSSTAEERYLRFLSDFPTLIPRLPNTLIASYLGITPEFLSRIRSNLAKN